MKRFAQWLAVFLACAAFSAALVVVRIKNQKKQQAGGWAATAYQPPPRTTVPAGVHDWYLITKAWSEGAFRDSRAERVGIRISLFLTHGGQMDGRSVALLLGKPDFTRQSDDGSVEWGFGYPLTGGLTRWFIVRLNANNQVTDHYFTDAQFKADAAGVPIHGWQGGFPEKQEWQRTWEKIVDLP